MNFEPRTFSLDASFEEAYDADGWPKASERNLTSRLRHDSDSFVRACLHENSSVLVFWVALFHGATHLERLALMRNERAAEASNRPVIERLFDPDDTTFAIDLDQRKELILAYISNQAVQRYSHLAEDYRRYMFGRAPLDEYSYSDRLEGWEAAREHFSKLWKFAQKWPAPVPALVFRYLGAEDQARSETYQQCSDWVLRAVIMESSVGRLHPQTIALGSKSSDMQILGSLQVLVQNRSLSLSQLEALKTSIRGLPDNVSKKTLLQDLESRIARHESKQRKAATGWCPPASATKYLAIATVVFASIAIIGPVPGLIKMGTVPWLLLSAVCGLLLNACVLWQSTAVTRDTRQTLFLGSSAHKSRHGRSAT
ncbi:MAG: hypothetical protein WBF04_18260 [Candidatus Sulfotelmatobacter sp.]